jgi:UDPglucose 6-dehydrogenase
MAEVCEASGADVSALADALGHDPRIGSLFLRAGLGFGGGCLPKDIRAFMARAEELGVDQAVSFLRDVEDINLRRRGRTVDLTREVLGGELTGARVGIWGAAFKPDSDDVRDSPALNVAQMLHDAGAIVKVHDPRAIANARAKWPELDYAQTAMEAAKGSDVLLHLTEWREYRALHPLDVHKVVSKPQLIDARNALDPQSWREAGWTYRALGRPHA